MGKKTIEKGHKAIRISSLEFLSLFRAPYGIENMEEGDRYSITCFDLPPDARAIAAEYEIEYDAFIIKIESAEFPQQKGYIEIIDPRRITLAGDTITRG